MPARLSIAEQEQQQVEVDLWGEVFVRVPGTKPRRRRITEATSHIAQIEVLAADAAAKLDIRDAEYVKKSGAMDAKYEQERVTAIGKLFDLMLSPIEGTESKPSALIAAKYKSGEVSWEVLEDFVDRLAEAVTDAPPT